MNGILKNKSQFSEKKLNEFKDIFYKGNEIYYHTSARKKDLIRSCNNESPNSLKKLAQLIKSIKKGNKTPTTFKNFCSDFSNGVFEFAKEKFSNVYKTERMYSRRYEIRIFL